MAAPWAHGAEVTIIGEVHGSRTNNVWHLATNATTFDNPTALNDALVALAEAMLACYIEHILPAVTSDWQLLGAEARAIAPAASDPAVVAATANTVGSDGPTNVSFASTLVNLRTGGGGKSGRGKKFLPPTGDPSMQNSQVDGSKLVIIGEFLACVAGKFLGASPTTDWRLGVLSQKILAGSPGNFDNAFRVVTSLTPSVDVAVLTSRRKGRGI